MFTFFKLHFWNVLWVVILSVCIDLPWSPVTTAATSRAPASERSATQAPLQTDVTEQRQQQRQQQRQLQLAHSRIHDDGFVPATPLEHSPLRGSHVYRPPASCGREETGWANPSKFWAVGKPSCGKSFVHKCRSWSWKKTAIYVKFKDRIEILSTPNLSYRKFAVSVVKLKLMPRLVFLNLRLNCMNGGGRCDVKSAISDVVAGLRSNLGELWLPPPSNFSLRGNFLVIGNFVGPKIQNLGLQIAYYGGICGKMEMSSVGNLLLSVGKTAIFLPVLLFNLGRRAAVANWRGKREVSVEVHGANPIPGWDLKKRSILGNLALCSRLYCSARGHGLSLYEVSDPFCEIRKTVHVSG